jgi:hypothetical protein
MPQYTELIADLQARNDWKLAGDGLANTGATGKNALATRVPITNRLMKFGVAPDLSLADPRWCNAYWYLEHGPRPEAHVFAYDVELWMPPEYMDAPQAIELDMQKQEDSIVYNMALQVLVRPTKALRWFRFNGPGAGEWLNLPIDPIETPVAGLVPGWNQISAVYEITYGHEIVFQQLVFNDQSWDLGVRLPAYIPPDQYRDKYKTNKFNTAFQLDLNGKLPAPTAYHVFMGEHTSVSIG